MESHREEFKNDDEANKLRRLGNTEGMGGIVSVRLTKF